MSTITTDRQLGSVIIMQALAEALEGSQAALAWLTTPGEEFDAVCAMADQEPASVRAMALDKLTDPNPQSARRFRLADYQVRKIPAVIRAAALADEDEDQAEPKVSRYQRTITFQGATRTIPEWSKTLGIPAASNHNRLKRGLAVDQVLSTAPLNAPAPKPERRPAPIMVRTWSDPQNYQHVAEMRITHAGRTQTIMEWAKETGISQSLIRYRLSKGWSIADAFRKVTDKTKRQPHRLSFKGMTLTVADWSARTGLSKQAILWRIRNGWSVEAILTTPQKDGPKATRGTRAPDIRQSERRRGVCQELRPKTPGPADPASREIGQNWSFDQ